MLDHLDDLRVFVRVAELESLSAAGRDLRLSPAVVSSRIARLEAATNVSLLWRTTRQVKLTAEGQEFLEHCAEILRAVDEAETSLAQDRMPPSGPVRITVPTSLGERIIAPALPAFSADFPHVNLQLHLRDRLASLVEEKYDLAVRVSELKESGLIMRKLADNRRFVCASPTYLDRHGVPRHPDELARHACLLLRFPGSKQYQWKLEGGGETLNLSLAGPLDADRTSVLKRWAVDGHGLTLQNYWDVADELASGALKAVLPDYRPVGHAIYAVYPRRRHMPPRVRVLLDYLIELFKDYRLPEAVGDFYA
jgi:DNA-binding transcriptional LysR family regulator